MTIKKSFNKRIRGWIPKDPTIPLPIKIASTNRSRVIDKKLLTGTIAVSLIILVFGAFLYTTFSAPIVRENKTLVHYQFKETEVEESIRPYLCVSRLVGGIFSGTVVWDGPPDDPVTQLTNIHLVSYACIVDRNYYEGHLRSVQVELRIAVTENGFTLPNDTIGYEEAVIPVLGVDSPQCQFNFDFPTTFSGVETWTAS